MDMVSTAERWLYAVLYTSSSSISLWRASAAKATCNVAWEFTLGLLHNDPRDRVGPDREFEAFGVYNASSALLLLQKVSVESKSCTMTSDSPQSLPQYPVLERGMLWCDRKFVYDFWVTAMRSTCWQDEQRRRCIG